ncbi:hypothetical protein ACH3XW_11425 [Acanthocheilonema viteae]|uniref:Uncharacterized protein n=1 Tax=Acanthocheilonema viteae TaxID=6277 RepID=A0A498S6G0_ACAVI|nr:unnamed protein product [Acanthocheilonema viteae]
MLYKGVVTKSKSEFLYVWSKNFGPEAILDKRLAPTGGYVPSIGDWIVFSIKVGSNFIDDFIDIPDLLPTKVNEHGGVMVKTRVSFRSDIVSGCNLLAHSNDLGVIGIFQNFPTLSECCDCDIWVERIPQALSNLEYFYKTSWYISGEISKQIVGISLERFSSVHSLSSEFKLHTGSPNTAFEDSCSDVATRTSRSSFSSVDFDEIQEYNQSRKRNSSKQSYFTEQQFFDCQPCVGGAEGEEIKESKAVVGLITSSFNGRAFVWSSMLGKGMVSLCSGQHIRHGEWIKFIPSRIDDICLQEHNELERCKYAAKDWYVVSPLYPTRSYRTIVSVQVRLFVPQSYQHDSSNLWAEFFGTVDDPLELIAKFGPLCNILGRCLLVRIMGAKSDCKSSNWIVHRVLQLLENEESVPKLKSYSFAADALRYMNEDLLIHNAMKKVDWNLVEQLREPHLLSDDILEHQN